MRLTVLLCLGAISCAQPTFARTPYEAPAIKYEKKLQEDVRIDASNVRPSLARMPTDAACSRPFLEGSAAPSAPADAMAEMLVGSWAHPSKGTWNFAPNGTGTLVRDSVNGIPGRYTITLRWSVEPGNTLVYTPIQNTLVGSPDSDRDEPIANPKTYRAPFEIVGAQLILGGASYVRM